jgi:NADH dehydrogenase [ubiquinone] 1 alpha subcomplex assembly factor 5
VQPEASAHLLFDRQLYRHRRELSGDQFHHHDFLHRAAEELLLERLDAIDRTFNRALILGAPSDALAHHSRIQHALFADSAVSRLPESAAPRCLMDEEWLPIADHSLDVILSVLTLHHVNDVAGALIQMHRALKPDGLLLAMTFGARSFMELRAAFADAEMMVTGGISPRISPFMEVRDGGGLLQRAGFALPVVDSEMLHLSYGELASLYHDLRGMGEANILHDRTRRFTSRSIFAATEAAYHASHSDEEERLHCTVELLCLTGWTPHDSQQKPLARGSGKTHLRDAFQG